MSGVVFADTTEDLVNALVTKGVLTEEEGNLLSKGHDKVKKNTPKLESKGGQFTIKSADEKNELALTGRMHFDYRNSDLDENDFGNIEKDKWDTDGKSMGDEFEMRRARIGIKGKLDGIWKYEVVLNGVGSSTNVLDTASLTFAAMKPFQIEAGMFKQAFNLEGLTSSNDIDFNERSWINTLSPHKKLGVAVKGEPTKGLNYAFTKYQHSWEDPDVTNENNYSGRVTYNFAEAMGDKKSIFHLGLAGISEDYSHVPSTSSNGGGAGGTTHSKFLTFKSAGRGFSPLASFELVGDSLGAGAGASAKGKQTNDIENSFGGLEGIFARGPFKLQGEYVTGNIEGRNHVNGAKIEADIKTAYLTAAYMLTGETYADSYKEGIMKGIKVAKPFDFEKGTGTGAWEIAARYEYLDIDNADVTRGTGDGASRLRGNWDCGTGTVVESYGESSNVSNCKSGADQYTIGLKWIANPNVLAKVSLTYSDYDNKVIAPDTSEGDQFDSETLLQTRVQWMF
ncbi:MAG: OprO/OprP family phosphate-selective porin [Methylophilaceae bacterium]